MICSGNGRDGFAENLLPGKPHTPSPFVVENLEPIQSVHKPDPVKGVTEISGNPIRSGTDPEISNRHYSFYNGEIAPVFKVILEEFEFLSGAKKFVYLMENQLDSSSRKFYLVGGYTLSESEKNTDSDIQNIYSDHGESFGNKRKKSLNLYASESVKWNIGIKSSAFAVGMGLGRLLHIDAMAGDDTRIQARIKFKF